MKPPTLLLTLLVAAGGGLALWLTRENANLRTEIARLREVPPTPRPVTEPAPARAGVEPVPPSAHAPTPPAAALSDGGGRALVDLKKRWRDPAWRAQRFNEAILRVERKYGRLFQRLGPLPPEKLEALKRQLAEGELTMAEAALPDKLPVDETEGAARRQAMQQAAAENDRQLQALLDDAGYANYEAFEKSQAYREAVSPLANAMRSGGVAVDEALEERMLDAYATAFRNASARAASADPTGLDEAGRAALKKSQMEALHLELMRQLSGVLNETQLNAFMQAQLESEQLP